MILSILIPTLLERKDVFDKLYERLQILSSPYRGVQILFNQDNREKTIGEKRNELVARAKGEFSAFIDDDDDVPDYYFDRIMEIIEVYQADCIGFKGELTWIGSGKREIFKHSAGLPYSSGLVNGQYLRPPNHLNPMLTEYFSKVGFTPKSFGEDYDFCMELKKRGLVKNEIFLDEIMYYYRFNPVK